MMYKSKPFLLTLLLTAFVGVILWLYGSQLITFFSLETLQCYAGYLRAFSNAHYYLTVAFYIVFGIGAVVLFLPVVTLYMLTAGFLFGPFEGASYAVVGRRSVAQRQILCLKALFYAGALFAFWVYLF